MIQQEVELTFYPYNFNSVIINRDIELQIFGKTSSGQKITVLEKKFKPYYYIRPNKNTNINLLLEKIRSLKVKETGKLISPIKVELTRNELKPIKITARNTADLQILRRAIIKFPEVSESLEYDIPFINRFIIDKQLIPSTLWRVKGKRQALTIKNEITIEADKIIQESLDTIEPKTLAFDIETLSHDPKKDSIIMCSFYSNDLQKVTTWKSFEPEYKFIHILKSEADLIEDVQNTIKKYNPDIIVGYGSEFFDIPYVKERAKKHRVSLTLLDSDAKKVRQLHNAIHLDLSLFTRKLLDLETNRYNLDSVARELIGKGKLQGIAKKINEIWSVGLPKELNLLAEYNLVDSEITYKIFQKIFSTQIQISKITSLPLYNVNRMAYGQLMEWCLIKNAAQKNVIIPRKPTFTEISDRMRHTYEGGFVETPKPGIYKKVAVLDFRSLYPSIVISHNVDPYKLNCPCCKEGKNKVFDNMWFCIKEPGFIPTILKEVVNRRIGVKQILKKTNKDDPAYQELYARQYALKIIASAMHGYLGFPASRWYSLECARAITNLGRKYIQDTIRKAKEMGFNVIYSDTDSLFIDLKERTIGDVLQFLKEVNSDLPEPMELELQDYYPAALFLSKKTEAEGAKKRYALLTEKGGLILKGIEAIRGDWSHIAKNTQKAVLEILLKEDDVAKAAAYVQNIVSKLKKKEIPLDKLMLTNRLTRSLSHYKTRGPHVRAAELAQKKGYPVGENFIVRYIIAKGDGKIADRAILAEDATLNDIDEEYYINHQVIRAVYKIFEVFNYSEDKLKAGQTTLSSF